MWKIFLYTIIFFLKHKINHVHSAGVKFNLTISPSRIELDCTYTFGKGEKHTSTSYSKDGRTFVEYAVGQDRNPTFTTIPGISLVVMQGGCRVTILNYQNPESMGLYEIKLKYTDKQGKPTLRKKRYKISIKVDKCQASWTNVTIGDKVPPGAFAAAFKFEQRLLYACRASNGGEGGYYEPTRGCVYTMGGKVLTANSSQVLTGTGFSWTTHEGDSKPPDNVFKFGSDWTGDMYLGRCNYQGSAFIGKITDGFFFNYPDDGESKADFCKIHDILLC